MDRLTQKAFDDHQIWLNEGGSESIHHVKMANLAAMFDKYIKLAHQEGYDMGYREGIKDATDGQS